MQLPVTVLNANTKREQGKKAQLGNIVAAKVRVLAVAEAPGVAGASGCCVGRGLTPTRVRAPRRALARLQAVADIIRTTLGPRSMLKMLLDPNGGEQARQGSCAVGTLRPPAVCAGREGAAAAECGFDTAHTKGGGAAVCSGRGPGRDNPPTSWPRGVL